jgi:predicted dehydrogenase
MKRRDFLSTTVAGSSLILGGTSLLSGCSTTEKKEEFRLKTNEELNLPPSLDSAPDGKALRFGLIGCGGRGTGAALNLLAAGNDLSIVAISDILPDRLESCKNILNEKGKQNITEKNAFLGFDGYKKVLDSDIDAVIIAMPSRFHPAMFEAAIEAGKHVFVEKPCAVDAPGVRKFMVAARQADQKGLSVVCGTQRRHGMNYIETYRQVASGLIGEIVGGSCYWCIGYEWKINRNPEWCDVEYMIRDWMHFPFLGGDYTVSNLIHNIDVVSWFMGNKAPVHAMGFGAKVHPNIGNKYDFFAVDYVFDNDAHIGGYGRSIDMCSTNVSEFLMGAKGKTNCVDTIWDAEGNEIWKYPYIKDDQGNIISEIDHYVREHIDWVTSIRTNKPLNDAHNMARSTLIGIMGRDSAYTGKTITWDEIMSSTEELGQDITQFGKMDVPTEHPLPGVASKFS